MSNFLTPGAMPRQVRNPCSGCGRLASTALINLRCSARSCRPNGGTDPASTPRSAGGSWAYGRGPCRACGRCNGADGRRRVGPDGKGPEGRRRSPPHRPELVRCRGQPTRRRVTRARVLRPSPTWGVRRQGLAGAAVRESGFDYTIVRPTRLTTAAGTGRYTARVGPGPVPSSIARADVARFILDALGTREYVGKTVSLGAGLARLPCSPATFGTGSSSSGTPPGLFSSHRLLPDRRRA